MRRLLVGVLILALTGCAARSSTDSPTHSGSSQSAVSSSIGTLKDVCGPGKAHKSSAAIGVTNTEVNLGVFTDVGLTQNPELVNTAKVFTSWCNAQGGINGRKLVAVTRDTKVFEVRQRMIEACRADFFLVGGSAALDGLAVNDRLKCMLPSFPAQTGQATGADLQVSPLGAGVGYAPFWGYYSWLLKEKYPTSASSLGIIVADNPIVKAFAAQDTESFAALGGKVTYSDAYPATGISDWTPYAQSIKKKKVKGLVFLGDFRSLAGLEQSLTNIGYKLDWIDANNSSYGPSFIRLAGQSVLAAQHSYADLSGIYPLETLADNPATREVNRLYQQYAPGAEVTLTGLRGFSAWLLFAEALKSCADDLTRRCVYDYGVKQTAWTAGGLQAPMDLTSPDNPLKCFNVVEATTQGWKAADFKPNNGAYRCVDTVYKLKKTAIKPATLASVGRSLADLK